MNKRVKLTLTVNSKLLRKCKQEKINLSRLLDSAMKKALWDSYLEDIDTVE